jgi:hypothetical protein
VLHHPKLVGAPRQVTATEFFAELCPALLRGGRAGGEHVLWVELFGAEGGSWYVDFAGRTVGREPARAPTGRLQIEVADFEAMLASGAAPESGAVAFDGAPEALDALIALVERR